MHVCVTVVASFPLHTQEPKNKRNLNNDTHLKLTVKTLWYKAVEGGTCTRCGVWELVIVTATRVSRKARVIFPLSLALFFSEVGRRILSEYGCESDYAQDSVHLPLTANSRFWFHLPLPFPSLLLSSISTCSSCDACVHIEILRRELARRVFFFNSICHSCRCRGACMREC